jgi:hypothetical protein
MRASAPIGLKTYYERALRRIAALLLGHWRAPNALVAPCAAGNATLSLGQASRLARYAETYS